MINQLTKEVIEGKKITKNDAIGLLDVSLNKLTKNADKIRRHYCGNNFDACTIINVKSGRCTEDCKFCSQSIQYPTEITEYSLYSKEQLKQETLRIYNRGFKRVSYVASGKTTTSDEFNTIVESIRELRDDYDISICVSLGLLSGEQIDALEEAGVDRIHNNLETS
ncbi:MAG: hypothetical protein BZ138_00115, partial [Methanosphaera sp. rholeuAM270]